MDKKVGKHPHKQPKRMSFEEYAKMIKENASIIFGPNSPFRTDAEEVSGELKPEYSESKHDVKTRGSLETPANKPPKNG